MNKFNITFICQQGEWKLSECAKFPTKEDIEENIKCLAGIGLGKVQKIIIDNIKM